MFSLLFDIHLCKECQHGYELEQLWAGQTHLRLLYIRVRELGLPKMSCLCNKGLLWTCFELMHILLLSGQALHRFMLKIQRKPQCQVGLFFSCYRKIPKVAPGAYIFQTPFLRGLFLEGLYSEVFIYDRKCA